MNKFNRVVFLASLLIAIASDLSIAQLPVVQVFDSANMQVEEGKNYENLNRVTVGSTKDAVTEDNEKLFVEPQIEWGTYYGGSGTEGLSSVATDKAGNVYTCGITYGSDGLADGGFQNDNPALNGGIAAAYLVKFDSAGDRIWATYYSGGGYTGAISVAVDSEGNVYMTGFTSDFGLSFNGYQNSLNGSLDAFLVKFSPSGERLWATYFGGSDGEVARTVAIDSQDNIYITGRTFSSDFPVLNAHQESAGADVSLYGDAFLAKFDATGDLLYSTYFGGPEGDFAFYVSCDNTDNVIITGKTSSATGIFLDGHQSEYGGDTDAFVAKYNAAGVMIWSSYYGGSGEDIAYACVTDNSGNTFITGETGSLNNIEFGGFQDSYAAAFLAKFDVNGNLEWGTYYGQNNGGPGSGANVGYGCAVDLENNVYMTGGTISTGGISSQGFQNNYGGGSSDGFVVKFAPDGDRLWGSYFGGSSNDFARGMHVDKASNVYLVGATQSLNGIFFDGFQSSAENESGFLVKITTCPEPQLLDLPQEVCAGTSLLLNPFPSGGTLQLIGQGEINQTTFFAPDVSESTTVTLRYITSANGLCSSSSEDFELTILPNVVASVDLSTESEIICENDEVLILADIQNSGSSPTINWFQNGQLVQEEGTSLSSNTVKNNDIIEVEVMSSNICSSPNPALSNSIVFTVNPIPDISLVFTDLQGGTLVTNLGFVNYEWFRNDELIPGATSSSYVPLENGTYTVVVTNEFGCENAASISLISVATTEMAVRDYLIYPNPTDGVVNIEFEGETPSSYSIYNSIGEVVFSQSSVSQTEIINAQYLLPGLYFVTFYLDSNVWVEKLVVR